MRQLMRAALVVFGLGLACIQPAWSQAQVTICLQTAAGPSCSPVTTLNPLPVTGSVSLTFPTIGAAVPVTGVYNAVNVAGTLRGWAGLSTGAIFPGAVAVVDASGNQITSFGGANVGATGSAVPASSGYEGLNVAGTLRGWTGVNSSGSIFVGQVDVASIAGTTTATGSGAMTGGTQRTALATDSPGIITTGTAGSASTQVLSVQGIASMTPLQVTQSAVASGGGTYARIAAGQATTVVKASAGTLYSICLNSAATATNTTTIYDNASGAGTIIGAPAVTTATVPTCLTYGPAGVAFALGLTIITATANGGDMTVSFK